MQKTMLGHSFEQNMTEVMEGLSFLKGSLENSTPVVVATKGAPLPLRVWALADTLNTIRVEYSLNDAESWRSWSPGDLTGSYGEHIFTAGITHLRFTRLSGSSTANKYGAV